MNNFLSGVQLAFAITFGIFLWVRGYIEHKRIALEEKYVTINPFFYPLFGMAKKINVPAFVKMLVGVSWVLGSVIVIIEPESYSIIFGLLLIFTLVLGVYQRYISASAISKS